MLAYQFQLLYSERAFSKLHQFPAKSVPELSFYDPAPVLQNGNCTVNLTKDNRILLNLEVKKFQMTPVEFQLNLSFKDLNLVPVIWNHIWSRHIPELEI